MSAPTNSTSKIKAVLFDCDGVLCPPLSFAAELSQKFDITTEMTRPFFAEAFNPALRGEVDVRQLLGPFLPTWGWPSTVDEFLTLWLESERHLRPEMLELVQAVRQAGFTTGLATNQEAHRGSYLRNEMGLNEQFDFLFISSELGAMKPSSEFFARATEKLGLNPAEILFIDDQTHYVDAAATFGWEAILFTTEAAARRSICNAVGISLA